MGVFDEELAISQYLYTCNSTFAPALNNENVWIYDSNCALSLLSVLLEQQQQQQLGEEEEDPISLA